MIDRSVYEEELERAYLQLEKALQRATKMNDQEYIPRLSFIATELQQVLSEIFEHQVAMEEAEAAQ